MKAPILYYYDTNKVYYFSQEALRDPMDTRWLIPSNATDIKPEIEAKEGFAICFDTTNKVWALIEDHRGEKFYSKETGRIVEIKTVGEIPNELTNLPKPDYYHTWSESLSNWEITPDKQALKDIAEAEERVMNNTFKKQELMTEVNAIRNDLMCRMLAGDGSTEDQKKMKSLNEFIDSINALDLTKEDLTFPAIPS